MNKNAFNVVVDLDDARVRRKNAGDCIALSTDAFKGNVSVRSAKCQVCEIVQFSHEVLRCVMICLR
jgi:hypothetical protein